MKQLSKKLLIQVSNWEISMDRMRSHLVASARAHDQLQGGNNWSVAAYWRYLHNTDNSIRHRQ